MCGRFARYFKQLRYLERVINMFYISIYDKSTGKSWKEEFESYYFFSKRLTKLKYSKKLVVTSRSALIG